MDIGPRIRQNPSLRFVDISPRIRQNPSLGLTWTLVPEYARILV